MMITPLLFLQFKNESSHVLLGFVFIVSSIQSLHMRFGYQYIYSKTYISYLLCFNFSLGQCFNNLGLSIGFINLGDGIAGSSEEEYFGCVKDQLSGDEVREINRESDRRWRERERKRLYTCC